MWRGMLHWAALRTNSSDQTSLSSATWSVSCSSGKPGMLRAHSTAEKSSLAANSQMESRLVMLWAPSWAPYLPGYGSALTSALMYELRKVGPPPVRLAGLGLGKLLE